MFCHDAILATCFFTAVDAFTAREPAATTLIILSARHCMRCVYAAAAAYHISSFLHQRLLYVDIT